MRWQDTTGWRWPVNQGCIKSDAALSPHDSAEKFIRIWQSSNSVAEVASRLGRKKSSVRVRAFRYRQMGVPLKHFPPVVTNYPDWKRLAEVARTIERESGTSRESA